MKIKQKLCKILESTNMSLTVTDPLKTSSINSRQFEVVGKFPSSGTENSYIVVTFGPLYHCQILAVPAKPVQTSFRVLDKHLGRKLKESRTVLNFPNKVFDKHYRTLPWCTQKLLYFDVNLLRKLLLAIKSISVISCCQTKFDINLEHD